MTTSPRDCVLGVWDGHDSGAALLQGDRVLFAINEERLTRRKLEVHFPSRSIQACLEYAGCAPSDVADVAYSTTDLAKTLTRTFPGLKEKYYQIRRRKQPPSWLTPLQKRVKYRLTQFFPSRWTRALSDAVVRKRLRSMGFGDFRLHCVDHHAAHAAGAYFSGFDQALVLTLDGIGDGLAGALFRLGGGRLERMSTIAGRNSLGIFFEHVTHLMNMRELEDEGKVMALANFAYPVADADNPMLPMMRVEGLSIHTPYSSAEIYRRLKKILWQFPSEQFCYMAQRALEVRTVELMRQALQRVGLGRVVLSGGVASNIKMNRLIRTMPEVKDLFVFPHMGDGGQALGAAAWVNADRHRVDAYRLDNLFLGPAYDDSTIDAALRRSGFPFEQSENVVEAAAGLLAKGEIVFWFQGRMELGPRALGGRSILALPNSLKIKEDLNLKLKKRVWYQPFCPSMLEEDARQVLEDFSAGHPDRFMTCAYSVKQAYRDRLVGVLNVDGTCRPQIVSETQSRFARLLAKIKEKTGLGILLNTSFNIHSEPLVCSPEDALRAFARSGGVWLIMGGYLVHKNV